MSERGMSGDNPKQWPNVILSALVGMQLGMGIVNLENGDKMWIMNFLMAFVGVIMIADLTRRAGE